MDNDNEDNNKMMRDMNFCVNIEHIQNCNENKTIIYLVLIEKYAYRYR